MIITTPRRPPPAEGAFRHHRGHPCRTCSLPWKGGEGPFGSRRRPGPALGREEVASLLGEDPGRIPPLEMAGAQCQAGDGKPDLPRV